MDAEQRGWLVLVRAGEEGKFSFATGFPITQRHVLTALHVLLEHVGSERPKTEAERAELRSKLLKTPLILRLPHKDRQKDYPAKVVWDGLERGLDALLLTAADAGDAPRFGRWGPVALRPPGADTRWQSEAWSQGGIESTEGEARRESVPLIGTVPGEVMPGQRLQLNADPAFVDKDDWKGASGSPVFVQGVICGILESYWTRMENSFHAVPMARLLGDVGFLEVTGLGSDEGYIERIRAEVVERLQESSAATDSFVRFVKERRSLSNKPSVDVSVEMAVGMTYADFGWVCNKAHRALHASGKLEAAAAIVDVLDLCLPALADRGVIASLKSSAAKVAFLPTGSPTVGAVLIAAYRQCQPHLSLRRANVLQGRFGFAGGEVWTRARLPEIPDLGMSPIDEEVDAIAEYLWHCVPAELRYEVREDDRTTRDQLINRQLEFWSERDAVSMAPYYLYRGSGSASKVRDPRRDQVATALCERFAGLHVARLDGAVEAEASAEEQELLGHIQAILGRSEQRTAHARRPSTPPPAAGPVRPTGVGVTKQEFRERADGDHSPSTRLEALAPKMAATHAAETIVLLTVNDHETDAVLDMFVGVGGVPQQRPVNGTTYNLLGIHEGMRIVHTISEMGAGSVGASQQRTQAAIRDWSPRAVVAVGIAFGLDEKQQQIGDVLVSTQIQGYDLGRMNADGTLTLRDDRAHASDALCNRLRQVDAVKRRSADWPKIRFGPLLSGQKLVDNLSYCESLKALLSAAIGGEMEAVGVYVAAAAAKTDWIVVKAICDWGHGKNHAAKDEWQKLAARQAASVLKAALDVGVLGGAP